MDTPRSAALDACDDALKESVSRISSVLLNALISAKSDKDRQDAADAASKGLQLSKDTHGTMKRLVEAIFR
jgi:hypothetical protein